MTDKIVAELMALADACMTLSRGCAEAHAQDEPGEEWALEQKLTASREALRAALSQALGDSQPVAWQERQARRINKAAGDVTEWTGWYECKPRKLTEPLAYTDPDDMIPREWRPLYASPKRAEPASVQALRKLVDRDLTYLMGPEGGYSSITRAEVEEARAALAAHPDSKST